jgi:hypothetical protein
MYIWRKKNMEVAHDNVVRLRLWVRDVFAEDEDREEVLRSVKMFLVFLGPEDYLENILAERVATEASHIVDITEQFI